MNEERERESSTYQLFMLALCVFVLAVMALEAVVRLDPEVRYILLWADAIVCGFFLFDFTRSLRRAPDRKRYMLTWGWIDLLSSIPAAPFLRWGRAARVVRVLRVLRAIRAARVVGSFILSRRAETAMFGAILATIIAVVVGSIAVLEFERPAGGNIDSARDALWWTFVTITSVGYGDYFPITVEGRLMATALMTVGVGLFGILTAWLASWFMRPDEEDQDRELAAIRRDLADIRRLLEPVRRGPAERGGRRPAGPDAAESDAAAIIGAEMDAAVGLPPSASEAGSGPEDAGAASPARRRTRS